MPSQFWGYYSLLDLTCFGSFGHSSPRFSSNAVLIFFYILVQCRPVTIESPVSLNNRYNSLFLFGVPSMLCPGFHFLRLCSWQCYWNITILFCNWYLLQFLLLYHFFLRHQVLFSHFQYIKSIIITSRLSCCVSYLHLNCRKFFASPMIFASIYSFSSLLFGY